MRLFWSIGQQLLLEDLAFPPGKPHVPYTGFLCKQKAAKIYRVDLNMTRLQIRFDPPSIQARSSGIIPYTPQSIAWVGLNTKLPIFILSSNTSLNHSERAHSFADNFEASVFALSWCSTQFLRATQPHPPSRQNPAMDNVEKCANMG